MQVERANPYFDYSSGYGYASAFASGLAIGGQSVRATPTPDLPSLRTTETNLRDALDSILSFDPVFDRLRSSARVENGSTTNITTASTSSASLGLDPSSTASVIESNEEINTEVAASSYSPTSPSFDVWSTSTPTLSGTYTQLGSDTWTVRVTQGGTLGTDDTQLTIYDENDSQIDVIDIAGRTQPGTTIDLGSGIDLELSAGDLVEGEEFTFDVSFLTSPAPKTPSFEVSSTSQGSIGGTYTGTTDETLTFAITSDGTIGSDDVTVELRDSEGSVIDTQTILGSSPADTEFSFSNGLTLSFSDGDLYAGNQLQVDVVAEAPLAVDPDVAFDEDPTFETGLSVTAGSFDIDGITIDVHADDTLNDVLDRITSSLADVTATFDSDTETISIERDTAGASGAIVLDNDSSGFLAATKLASAVTDEGTDPEADRTIDEVSSLSGISNGTFSINGTSFDIDTSTDSLTSILNAIEAADLDVTVTLASSHDSISIRSSNRDDGFTLDDGTSGFFTALGIDTGSFDPEISKGNSTSFRGVESSARRMDEIAETLQSIVSKELGSAFENLLGDDSTAPRETLRKALVNVVRDHVDAGISSDATRFEAYGISFDFEEGSDEVIDIDPRAFARAAADDPHALVEFLLAEGGSNGVGFGLGPALDQALDEIAATIRDAISETRERLVDAWV